MSLFTAGIWIVKEGHEAAFVDAWRDLAEWTSQEMPGTTWAKLLQDADNPRRFQSFGPWDSAHAIEAWRTSEGFQQRIGRIRDLLESFEAHTMDAVAEIGTV